MNFHGKKGCLILNILIIYHRAKKWKNDKWYINNMGKVSFFYHFNSKINLWKTKKNKTYIDFWYHKDKSKKFIEKIVIEKYWLLSTLLVSILFYIISLCILLLNLIFRNKKNLIKKLYHSSVFIILWIKKLLFWLWTSRQASVFTETMYR